MRASVLTSFRATNTTDFKNPARFGVLQKNAKSMSTRPFKTFATQGNVQAFQGNVQSFQEKKNVVVAVDASEDSMAAVYWAIKNVIREGDTLKILHVVPDFLSKPASGSIYYPQLNDVEAEKEALWRQAEDFIEKNFVDLARANNVACNVVLVKESKKGLGNAVCAKAEELEASPLVLAAHDKSFFEQMFLGSVSKFCASKCKRPVVLVHPQHTVLPFYE